MQSGREDGQASSRSRIYPFRMMPARSFLIFHIRQISEDYVGSSHERKPSVHQRLFTSEDKLVISFPRHVSYRS